MTSDSRQWPEDCWQTLARARFMPRHFPCKLCGIPCAFGYCLAVGAVANLGCPVYTVEFFCPQHAEGRTPLISAHNIPLRFEVTAVFDPSTIRVVRRTRAEAEERLA